MNKRMKIYINPLTVNNIKLLLLCNALKINPDFQHVAIQKGEQKQKTFLALNPEGKVPVLQQDDLVLTESNAIMQYLAHSQNSQLWPKEIELQTKVLSILFWQTSYFSSGVGPIAHKSVVLPYWGFNEPEIDEQQWQAFDKALSGLEKKFYDSNYLVGNKLSIADISLAAFFIFHKRTKMTLQHYPKLNAWLANLADFDWYSTTETYLNQIMKD